MKRFHLLFFFAVFFAINLAAQAKTAQQLKAEKNLTAELDEILRHSATIHWAYTDSMTIEEGFSIDANGVLSVIVRYYDAGGNYYRVKIASPVNKLNEVIYDMYIVLTSDGDNVTVYSTPEGIFNTDELVLAEMRDHFHVGAPGRSFEVSTTSLQKLLNNVKAFYPRS